jgi:hypothetical protein
MVLLARQVALSEAEVRLAAARIDNSPDHLTRS